MSCYKDIYNDFPLRCGKLWKHLREKAVEENLDVTFMLMTAAAGFAAPYEHYKNSVLSKKDKAKRPPSFEPGNDKHYKKVFLSVTSELESDLSKSRLFGKLDKTTWKLRTLDNLDEIRDYIENAPIGTGRAFEVSKARDLIRVFRNALAHNNLHAFNKTGAAEIDEIVFFSEARGGHDTCEGSKTVSGYNVVSMPHTDFATFLDTWFELLEEVGKSKSHLRKILKFIVEGDSEELNHTTY